MIRSLLAAAAVCAAATPAAAHIVLAQPQAKAGSYYVASFRVGHGCDGKATTALRVELPEGIDGARVRPTPGWTVQRSAGAITWRGRLEEQDFQEFSLLMRLPETPGPLYFPTIQTCGRAVTRWVDRPQPDGSWPDNSNPAPVVMLTR